MEREEAFMIKQNVFGDDRGTFFPLDITDSRWLQSNVSISKKWTFRGLHHQKGDTAQAKQVTVIKGSIIDFVVDLRKGSFMDTKYFKMLPGDQVYVPKGFAHGFIVLEEDTIIQYLVDNIYSPSTEISFDWKSVEMVKEIILAEVGNESQLFLSTKDSKAVQLTTEHVEINL